MQKTAAFGFFDNIMSGEDVSLLAPMFSEMIRLPKYSTTIEQLRKSSGLINFVIKDGYVPLIECLLKEAYPLDNNVIFNNGDMEVTGSSFTMGPEYFGTIPDGSGKAIAKARKSFEDLLLGSDALMTRDYLKQERKMTDAVINQTYGEYPASMIENWLRADQAAKAEDPNASAPLPREVTGRTAPPGAMIGWQMAVYEYLLKKIDDGWGNAIRDIDRQIKGENVDEDQTAVHDEDEIRSLKANKELLMGQRRDQIMALKEEYYPVLGPLLNNRSQGTSAKNRDGFINYNPAKSVVDTSRNLIRLLTNYDPNKKDVAPLKEGENAPAPIGQQIQKTVVELKGQLKDYPFQDRHLSMITSELFKTMGDGNPEDLLRMKNKLIGTTSRLQNLLSDNLMSKGKVLILDEFDKTVLCQQGSERGRDVQGAQLMSTGKSVLERFIAENNSNREKDNTESGPTVYITLKDVVGETDQGNITVLKDTYAIKVSNNMYEIVKGNNKGKTFSLVNEKESKTAFRESRTKNKKDFGSRILLVISSQQIAGLPTGSTVIEMDATPVNPEEAEIIVRNHCDRFERKRIHSIKLERNEAIETQFDGDLEAISKEKRKGVLTPKDKEESIPQHVRKKMASYISGLNVKDAIIATVITLERSITRDENDPLRPKIGCDTNKLINLLRDDVNKRIQTDVLGVKISHADVAFEEYAYNKYSAWADQVQGIGDVKMSLDAINAEITTARSRISEIDGILTKGVDENGKKLTEEDRADYVAEREIAVAEVSFNEQDRSSMAANDIPHIYLLHGKPGVGKCLGQGTPVLMFDGSIKNVEEIGVGELLMGPDSKPRTVLTTINGVGPLYRVEQKLGDSYICNNAHLLSIHSTDEELDQEPTFISAEDFCGKNKTWKYRHKGWKVGVEFEEQKLPISPYWMGLWLGDGVSRIPSIMVADKDKEIAVWLQQWATDNNMFIRKEKQQGCSAWHFTDMQGSNSGCVSNHIKTELRSLNLLQNKHIPEIYWKNSSKNRLELLAGLIDSDGYMTKTGSIQFTNVNERLAFDFLYLARSLGFRVTFAESVKGIKKLNYTVKAYTITLGGTLSRIPSRLTRKQGHDNPQKKSLRYGIEVNPIGEGKYFGFTIDSDQQFLLGDFTVTHNSVWAHALASLFKLTIIEVDITAQLDKWVGSSGRNASTLLKMMGNSKSTVFLIDEIDRQVDSGAAKKGQSKQEAHEVTKQIVYHFLQFFEDTNNNRLFKANEVFFIMTSNHADAIDKAWLQRTGTGFYEVKLPEDPEDYMRFFKSYMNVERARFPDYPWFQSKEEVAAMSRELSNLDEKERSKIIKEKGWENTFRIINTQLDWNLLAKEFAGKKIDFRTLKMILQQAYSFNGFWNNSIRLISESSDPAKAVRNLKGLPLSTENILQTANFAKTAEEDNKQFTLGVVEVAARKKKKMQEMLNQYEGQPFAMEEYIDPFTQQLLNRPGLSPQKRQEIILRKTKKRIVVPQDVLEYMSKGIAPGEETIDIDNEVWKDYKEEIDPKTGLVKGVDVPTRREIPPEQLTPQQEQDQLEDEAFQEEERDKEAVPLTDEDEDIIASTSTDYYYQFLKKKGVINKQNEIVKTKKARREMAPQNQAKKRDKGELFYNGFVMIAQGPE